MTRKILLFLLMSVSAIAQTAPHGTVIQCTPVNNLCTGNGINTACTVTFNNNPIVPAALTPVRPHDTLFAAIWTLVGDNTITIASVSGDAAFTIGPHAGEATTAGGVSLAGLQNATGGETALVITASAAPAGTWFAAACELTPSVLEVIANSCSGTDGTAGTTHTGCTPVVQSTCHGGLCNDNIIQCTRGISSNFKSLDGYQTILQQQGSGCAFLNTTSGAPSTWRYSSNTKVAFIGWGSTDLGGSTLR